MAFTPGQHIEVSSKEEGFVGSYYEATVVTEVLRQEYIVKYKALMKEDDSGPLTEVVTIAEIRPLPPNLKIPASGFQMYDQVDVLYNDGWWAGIITGKFGGKWNVYFDISDEEIAYDIACLRVHQDWVDGKWVVQHKQYFSD